MRGSRLAWIAALVVALALVALWAIRSLAPVESTPRVASVPAAPSPETRAEARPVSVTEPAEKRADPPPTSRPTPPPSAFGTFRGRVIDAATREPLREFVVEFLGAAETKVGKEAPGARTFRSEDGRFEWDYLPPGRWTVVTTARGYQRFNLHGLQVQKAGTTPEILLPMRRGLALRGRVVDEDSGAGIASAGVSFREADVGRFDGDFRMRPRTTSGKDGRFLLDGIPPGRIILSVGANGYAGREVEVAVGDEAPPMEIALSAGASISGRLVAEDGVTPVAGSAGLFNQDTQSGSSSRTGQAGEFSYEHLAPGRYTLHGQAQSGRATLEIILAKNQRVERLVLRIGGGRSIRGVVTGLRDEELKFVSISVGRVDGAPAYEGSGVDERGAFVIHGVSPGRAQLVADVQMRRQLGKEIDVPADSDVTVSIDFPAGARLSGRVTRDGRPIAGLWIAPHPLMEQPVYIYGVSTSPEGEYSIRDVANGRYHIYAGDYRSKVVQVSGDTVFDIEIPDVQLAGRVVESGNVPVVAADIELWSVDARPDRIRLSTRTDHFGAFTLAGMEPGDFLLSAYKAGYEMYRERISYDSPVTDMILTLRPNQGVEIRVRDSDTGKPLDAMMVFELIARDRDGNYRRGVLLQLRLDEGGVGYMPSGLAGANLSFVAEGYAPRIISGWNGQPLDLRLLPTRAQ